MVLSVFSGLGSVLSPLLCDKGDQKGLRSVAQRNAFVTLPVVKAEPVGNTPQKVNRKVTHRMTCRRLHFLRGRDHGKVAAFRGVSGDRFSRNPNPAVFFWFSLGLNFV